EQAQRRPGRPGERARAERALARSRRHVAADRPPRARDRGPEPARAPPPRVRAREPRAARRRARRLRQAPVATPRPPPRPSLFAPIAGGAAVGRAQGVSEYGLKAVFLFNFTQFIEWPSGAFASADAPLCIGVLGEDPFGSTLDEAVRGESSRGRPLTVRRARD